jgi:hypothetical protein
MTIPYRVHDSEHGTDDIIGRKPSMVATGVPMYSGWSV